MKRTLLSGIGQLATVRSRGNDRQVGRAMSDIGIINDAALLFGERIEWVGSGSEANSLFADSDLLRINLKGEAVIPGFVDSHSHLVFAGSRSGEFARRLQGVSYQTIASEGGGILSTMRAVREATVEQLAENAQRLAMSALHHGTTTIEIKSGYGLSLESEMNLLRAIQLVKQHVPLRVKSTFLGAHDFPPEFHHDRERYVDLVITEMIPRIADAGLAEFIDVFSDEGYFTLDQSKRILLAGRKAGMKLKIHADELASFGAAELAGELEAVSADHLLNISENGMTAMTASGTVATLLPGTAYTLRLPYAPARAMIDRKMTVALATDCNPGSCLTENMQTILSLACTNMSMSIEEAITAATLNGAAALGYSHEVGSIEVGKLADFLVLGTDVYSDIVYHFGHNHVKQVWIGGVLRATN